MGTDLENLVAVGDSMAAVPAAVEQAELAVQPEPAVEDLPEKEPVPAVMLTVVRHAVRRVQSYTDVLR